MKLVARIPVVIAIVAICAMALSGLGVRQGWWTYRIGFQIMEWSAYAGLAAAALALISIGIRTIRAGALSFLCLAILLGLVTAYLPWHWKQQAQALPKIHDISTDLDNPPRFVKILPLRAGSPNPSEYGGPQIAAAQKAAYADIQPRETALTPADAFARALAAAKNMGWQIVDADAGTGVIEATATTLWFGFKDDVVIRISPSASGSRIDMRSVSRVGKSDVGANAARIRQFFGKLAL